MKRGRISFWDVLAWIVLGLILLWLILRVAGIINTLALIEYAPYFGAVYIAGWAMSVLVRATQDISGMKRNLSFLNKNFHELDKSIEIIRSNSLKYK